MKRVVDLTPKRSSAVSPRQFKNMTREEKDRVESARFVPPKLGSKSFGRFIVTKKYPTYTLDNGPE